MRYKRQSMLAGLVMVLSLFLGACRPISSPATPSAPGISVAITSDLCPNIVVNVNQQVTWTNQDIRGHIVRDEPAEGNGQFDSGTLQTGDSFAFTFPQEGAYTYECSTDGTMTGTVMVQR
jgi:hypothetical protein